MNFHAKTCETFQKSQVQIHNNFGAKVDIGKGEKYSWFGQKIEFCNSVFCHSIQLLWIACFRQFFRGCHLAVYTKQNEWFSLLSLCICAHFWAGLVYRTLPIFSLMIGIFWIRHKRLDFFGCIHFTKHLNTRSLCYLIIRNCWSIVDKNAK